LPGLENLFGSLSKRYGSGVRTIDRVGRLLWVKSGNRATHNKSCIVPCQIRVKTDGARPLPAPREQKHSRAAPRALAKFHPRFMS
jgi:hypothetical protein